MSIFSATNAHVDASTASFEHLPITLYSPNSSKPFSDNHRLCVVSFQKTKSRPNPPAARCISIPKLNLEVAPAILHACLSRAYHDLQKALVRAHIEKHLEQHNGIGTCNIPALSLTDLAPAAVALFASEQATGGHLTKDIVATWYDENMAASFELALANKLGYSEINPPNADQIKNLDATVAQYRDVITKLSAPGVKYPPDIASALLDAFSILDASTLADAIPSRLVARLEDMKSPKKFDLMARL
jgi:hypothetical protein